MSSTLIRLLTTSGIGSRRWIAAIIKRGGISVNGTVVESFNEPVDPAKDVIAIDGKPISVKAEPVIYLALNKPKGIISSTSDKRGFKTVIDILPEKYRQFRLYPVGRLDKDSTGLTLLTNDGDFALRLTHPRFEKEKEYVVRIGQSLKAEDRMKLQDGVRLDDGKTSPARVKALKYPPFSYSVTIHEGRKRQVRRMFAALGYRVLELKRVRIGGLRLASLAEWEIRELTPTEVQSLKSG
jgi:23S rRNA pseudouridine2605 synthase